MEIPVDMRREATGRNSRVEAIIEGIFAATVHTSDCN